MNRKRIVVLASGTGTNFQALVDAVKTGKIDAEIVALISDRSSCGALDKARANGIEAISYPRNTENQESYFEGLLKTLKERKPDLIVLAGFMKILPAWLVEEFPFRIINTHPALLPCFGGSGFYGNKVHEKVIESGARISGSTVHFVTRDVDAGPIILQKAVEVRDDDTSDSLAERVKSEERKGLVEAVGLVLSGNFHISGKRVVRGN